MDQEIVTRVLTAKNDPDELNKFINEYKPFIASCIQKYTGKFMEYGKDDELSIGLMAFHEAINSYDPNKGNFLTFATHVIRRRLIDYYRKEKSFRAETSIDISFSCDGNDEILDLSIEESLRQYARDELDRTRRFELEELKQELSSWKISFFDVARACPKQERTKELYRNVIKYIISNNDILETMITKKYLPIAKVCEELRINRKKVERGRSYIIAGVLIMYGDYELIQDFIGWR